MKSKKLWLGMLAMVLVFGMAVVGVEAQSNSGGIDGLWDFSDDGIWVFEKGTCLIFDDEGDFSEEFSYTIRGNTLIDADGDEIKFSIRGNTLTFIDGEPMTGTKIVESQSPVGRWIPARGQSVPSSFPEKSLELTNDGNGIGDGMGLKWKVENSRITFNFGAWGAYAFYYIIYKSRLILANDDDTIKYTKR